MVLLADITSSACSIPGLPIAANTAQKIVDTIHQMGVNDWDLNKLSFTAKSTVCSVYERSMEIVGQNDEVPPALQSQIDELNSTLDEAELKCREFQSQGWLMRFWGRNGSQNAIRTLTLRLTEIDDAVKAQIIPDGSQPAEEEPRVEEVPNISDSTFEEGPIVEELPNDSPVGSQPVAEEPIIEEPTDTSDSEDIPHIRSPGVDSDAPLWLDSGVNSVSVNGVVVSETFTVPHGVHAVYTQNRHRGYANTNTNTNTNWNRNRPRRQGSSSSSTSGTSSRTQTSGGSNYTHTHTYHYAGDNNADAEAIRNMVNSRLREANRRVQEAMARFPGAMNNGRVVSDYGNTYNVNISNSFRPARG